MCGGWRSRWRTGLRRRIRTGRCRRLRGLGLSAGYNQQGSKAQRPRCGTQSVDHRLPLISDGNLLDPDGHSPRPSPKLDGETMSQLCDFAGQPRWYANIDSAPPHSACSPIHLLNQRLDPSALRENTPCGWAARALSFVRRVPNAIACKNGADLSRQTKGPSKMRIARGLLVVAVLAVLAAAP